MNKFFLLGACMLAAVVPAFAADSTVVFNEIQYHPLLGQAEFIELRSLHGVDVDISGWTITGGVDYTFPANTVVTGGAYVLVKSATGTGATGAIGSFTGALNNNGDTLKLRNLNGRIMDELTYNDSGDWPLGADGSGATLARRVGTAASGPAAWATSTQIGGTPGAKNFAEPSDPPTVTTQIAMGATWKYRADNVAQADGWTATAFDDSAWSSGAALLYAGSPNVTGAGEGLLGYWPLSQTTGTTAPNLATGGTVGTLFTGATWVTDGTRGQVLNLDGVDGYVDAGTIPQMTLTNNFTWSFWANSSQTSGNVIVGNRTSPSGLDWSPREFTKFTPQTLQYDHNLVENIDYVDIPTGSWIHHAVVKQGATMTYYRNGVVGGTLTISAQQNNAQPFYFGGDKTAENWAGKLDDIAVWTKALPATSISSLAAGTVTPLTAPTGSSGGTLTTAVAAGPTTHYFRKAFTFSGALSRTTLTLQHMLDDGAVFYLNGTEVYRANMPTGTITHTTAASSDITSTALSSTITIPSTALVVGTNVLAVEVHQSAASTDMVFGASLVASETAAVPSPSAFVLNEISGALDASFYVELRNTSASAASTSGWSILASTGQTYTIPTQTVAAGGYLVISAATLGFTPLDGTRLYLLALGGTEVRDARDVTGRLRGLTSEGRWGYPTTSTQGAANVVTVSNAIVINEIFYQGLDASPEQWIELHNRSAAAVDVSLWSFTDGVSYQFPAGTPAIAPGGFVVIAWDTAAFTALHPGVTPKGPWSGSLSGKGETITLSDANSNVADQVTYSDGGRWSQWANGGGSSLELIDPDADNSRGEAWDASDESSHSAWQTVSYSGQATNAAGNDPTTWNEFIFGLLNNGEVLIDDISVKDVTQANAELIQNGNFSSGTANFWRVIGTHSGSIVDDPLSAGNKVLKVAASAETEHMHNHATTTLKNGATFHTIVSTDTYTISFRAKWLRGSNALHTRLYVDRLARKTLLTRPATGGTPGAVNSRYVANLGPTFDALSHSPVVPASGVSATVSVKVSDPEGVASVQLFTSLNGAAFTSVAMTTGGDGIYTGTVAGQASGALVQFYVRATDTPGAISFYPPGGAAARAMIPWDDGRAMFALPSGAKPHNLRVVMPGADANELYKSENMMSNASMPCTVIYDESVAYYRAGVSLKSSEHGRWNINRVGYNIEFPSDDLFLGTHGAISIDRSTGSATGQKEILVKTLSILAGGVHAPQDDLIRLIPAVATGTGAAYSGAAMLGAGLLSKTRLKGDYLDNQWDNGGKGMMFKYERIYVLTQTINPVTRVVDATIVPENPKISQDTTSPPGVAVTNLGANPEFYRWHWLVESARDTDDFTGIMNVTNAVGQAAGATFNTLTNQYIDVNEWLRANVPSILFGVGDNYMGSGGGQHNTLIYFPPGGKAQIFPWDLDISTQGLTTASLTSGGDVDKFIVNPLSKRLYYGHLLDILNRSFNTATMTKWATHYSRFSTDDMTSLVTGYLTPRAAFARDVIYGLNGQVAPIAQVAFARTSASPATSSTPFTTLTGNGWVNVSEIRLAGSNEPLAVTWTGQSTWSLQLPVSAGTNTYTLNAYDPQGALIGTTSVVVNGTGGIFPAGPGTLIVSELNFNPNGSTDATEFIELLNITGATLDLSGCHFDEELGQGINYTFASGVQIPPGARIIVPRIYSEFTATYPTASPVVAVGYDPSALDNGGESLVLYAASGLEIFRFAYTDIIGSTDGGGKTLVRVIKSSAPNPNDYTWRASTNLGGNPGTTDAAVFFGTALADDDKDGISALMEYALGTSDSDTTPAPWTITRDVSGNVLFTFPHAVNADDVILMIESTAALGSGWATATATKLSSTTLGDIATETWQITPPPGGTGFYVRLKATLR